MNQAAVSQNAAVGCADVGPTVGPKLKRRVVRQPQVWPRTNRSMDGGGLLCAPPAARRFSSTGCTRVRRLRARLRKRVSLWQPVCEMRRPYQTEGEDVPFDWLHAATHERALVSAGRAAEVPRWRGAQESDRHPTPQWCRSPSQPSGRLLCWRRPRMSC